MKNVDAENVDDEDLQDGKADDENVGAGKFDDQNIADENHMDEENALIIKMLLVKILRMKKSCCVDDKNAAGENVSAANTNRSSTVPNNLMDGRSATVSNNLGSASNRIQIIFVIITIGFVTFRTFATEVC